MENYNNIEADRGKEIAEDESQGSPKRRKLEIGGPSGPSDNQNSCKLLVPSTSNNNQEGVRDLFVRRRVPRSPWIPFKTMMKALVHLVPADTMQRVRAQYELVSNKIINRDEFIRRLRAIVGDEVLRSIILAQYIKQPRV